jgi:anti-anti-sigma regulatory factor
MEMTTRNAQGKVVVTIFKLSGSIDGSNYREVIAKGNELYKSGSQNMLIDLSDVPYISSSGLVALHRIALTMRGESAPEPELGWSALREMTDDVDKGFQQHLKILNPQPKVMKILDTAGFNNFLEIFSDLDTAVASFS